MSPPSSSCSVPDWTHVLPCEEPGRLAGSPQAAIPLPPEWGHLTSSLRVTSHFHPGCKDLKGWHSPIHPNIRVWPNPCVFVSYAPSVEPDACMDHWQEGHCEPDREMDQEWSQGFLDKGLFCRPAAEPSCLHINTFQAWITSVSWWMRDLLLSQVSGLFGAERDIKETFHQRETRRHSRLVPFYTLLSHEWGCVTWGYSITEEYAGWKMNTTHLSNARNF